MSATDFPPPEDEGPAATAGEYVLGLLASADHAAAARRVQADAAFAAEVAGWEARLTPLIAYLPEVEPPARLWPAIAGRLSGTVTPLAARRGPWNSLALWRTAAVAASALAAACLLVVMLPRTPPPTPPSSAVMSIARLDAPGGGAAFVATLDETRRQLIITPTGAPDPKGRTPELWLIPAQAAPVSLGVFMGQTPLVVSAPPGVTPGAQLGVSLEPRGGSPSGAPTGPVIAVGRLMRL